MPKKAYRVCNWKEYNKALVQRGDLTFWFSPKDVDSWQEGNVNQGHGNQKYTDLVIKCGLTLRQLFRLTLRATEGMLKSLVKLMGLSVEVPNYTTLCRRGKGLKIKLKVKAAQMARHVLVDSTGIQVVGEGEWKTLRHGKSKHQVWRKLHLALDADDQTILAATMTESVRADGNYLPKLINEIKGCIRQITGDGAYDKKACYRAAYERKAKAVFPPQHDAIVQRNKIKKDPALLQRDETIRFLKNGEDKEERRQLWKQANHYHRRSLAETMMSRMKSLFGDRMRSKTFENQRTDLLLRCNIINRMNKIGLPISYCIGQ